MYYFIFILLLTVLAIVIYLARLDGRYTIRSTQMINADINTVFNKITDFKTWADWSPWLIHEPDTTLEFSENCSDEGGFYDWDGRFVGAGKLTHVKFDRPHLIEQRLKFIRPFKSVCDVGFEFSDKGGKTEVTWFMNGKMPFFLRFMTEKTRDMISKDYELGLLMLSGLFDPKAEHPVLKFEGETILEPVNSLCQNFSGGLKAMEETMQQSFPNLMSYLEQQHAKVSGAPFTAYHKVDIKNFEFVCDMAIPVAEDIDEGVYRLKTLGGGRFYKVVLKGNYQFLELAWYSAMAHVHMLKIKYDKNRDTLEVYENNPEQVKTNNELLTSLYIPIK